MVTLSFSAYCGRLDVSKSTGLSVFCNSLNISSPLTSTIIGLSAVFSGLYCSAQQRQLTDTTKFKIKKGMTGIIPWSWWRCKTDYANAPPTCRSQPLAAGVLPPAFLSLSNLLSRKFENLLKCPQKNLFIKKRLLYGGRCKTRTCDQTVMSGRL